jgi:hypothetical protein
MKAVEAKSGEEGCGEGIGFAHMVWTGNGKHQDSQPTWHLALGTCF